MNNDPLLSNSYFQPPMDKSINDTADIAHKLDELYRRRRANEENISQPVIQQPRQNNILVDIEKEFEELTDEQKFCIYSDEEYQKAELEFTQMIQAEIISFIKPRLLNNEKAVKLLEGQKDLIRVLKRKMNSETEQRMKEFKEYTEKYSDMTYDEYKELINSNKTNK